MSLITRNIFFISLMLILCLRTGLAEDKLVFSTWDTFEVDKCASIWLIKHSIASDAEIRFYPQGEEITEGIVFDTPNALFRRYHNKSTFETLLDHYKLTDDKLIYLGRIIHDIEVNIWEKKVMKETNEVKEAVRVIISKPDRQEIVMACYQYFGTFYD